MLDQIVIIGYHLSKRHQPGSIEYMKMKNIRMHTPKRHWKKLAIGTMAMAIVAIRITTFTITAPDSNKATTNKPSRQESEILGVSESEEETDENSSFAKASDSTDKEVQPTSTSFPSPSQQKSDNTEQSPTVTPQPASTIIYVEVVLTPTPEPTLVPTTQPAPYINPEIEEKLAELRQTLEYIQNQPVPMSVIEGRKQKAYQDWISNNPEIFALIQGSRYIYQLNSILASSGSTGNGGGVTCTIGVDCN